MSEFNVIRDLTRELEKALDVVTRVRVMMDAEAEMNAAKHMSDRVRPNPLAAAVHALELGIESAVERGRAAYQGELPLEFPDATYPPMGLTVPSGHAVPEQEVRWLDPWEVP